MLELGIMRKAVLYVVVTFLTLFTGSVYGQLNKEYFYYVGRSYLLENQYEEAIETLNVLLKVDKDAHEGYFLRGIAKYNLDDLIGAEHDFSTAIKHNPVYTQSYLFRAITRSRLGNYDDALHDFEEAIDLRPDRPNPYFSRGVTYLLSEQYDKAIKDFDQFIKYENRVADAYVNRGTAYLFQKDTIKAMDNYNQAIRTNRDDPNGYFRRGTLYLIQDSLNLALTDFNKAISCDTNHISSYFNRAVVYSKNKKLMESLNDFDKVIELDSTNSRTYFNRAIVRSQIGDYNRALEDYDKVAYYSPDNVLVYYNRALLQSQLGNVNSAIDDYSKAIELYPDFANAYINRSNLKYLTKDLKGSKADKKIAEKKIAEYRSKLADSTFSIYADTSRKFNQLLSFDTKLSGSRFRKIGDGGANISLLPMFKFVITIPDTTVRIIDPQRYWLQRVEDFKKELNDPTIVLTTQESIMSIDSLIAIDRQLNDMISANDAEWHTLFKRGITQSIIKQYTNSVNIYTTAIEKNPTSPFLYLNRSATQSEMIDFVSSIDNSYQKITIDNDPVNKLKNNSTRTYNYDEAIADLNKAIKLYPEFAHLYYNRANLHALSGRLAEAYEDYTEAIKLWDNFAEAYFNRGLVQIFLKDTRKGCLDVSKAGELGIKEAYVVLKRYAGDLDNEGDE